MDGLGRVQAPPWRAAVAWLIDVAWRAVRRAARPTARPAAYRSKRSARNGAMAAGTAPCSR